MAITATAVTQATNSATPTFSFGFTANAGDLLVFAVGEDGAGTCTWPSPWVELRDGTFTGAAAFAAYLIAAGGETSVSPTGTVSERWEGIIWRIPAGEWHGTTPPEIAAANTGTGTAPDPPSITPSWGSETNNIYIAVAYRDDSVVNTITAYPTNYTTAQLDQNATTSACNTGGAVRIVTGSPENPGTFTISASETWLSVTIAVRPAAANVVVTPGTRALVTAVFAPVIQHKIIIPVKALTITSLAPVIKHGIIVPVKALAITSFAPVVTATANQLIVPITRALIITSLAPTVLAPRLVTPATLALVTIGLAPVVTATANQLIIPATYALITTRLAPTVTVGGGPAPVPAQGGGGREQDELQLVLMGDDDEVILLLLMSH